MVVFFWKKSRQQSTTLLVLVGAICCVGIASFQTNDIRAVKKDEQPQEHFSIETTGLQQRLATLKILPTLGFRNLLADATFLSFLQYFSDVSNEVEGRQHLSPDFFDTIITLDPFYRDYYLFLSGSTTFYAAQPEKTVELMAKGLKHIDPALVSDSFYIWRYKGTDELLFLGDSKSAKESFESAAEWASQSERPDSDTMERISRQTAEFLAHNPDSIPAQVSAWNSVLSSAMNDDIREEATQRIQNLTAALQTQKNGARANSIQQKDSVESETD